MANDIIDDNKDTFKVLPSDSENSSIQLDELPGKKVSKQVTPPLTADISTSRKQSMDYFTTDGVKLRTGYQNKQD